MVSKAALNSDVGDLLLSRYPRYPKRKKSDMQLMIILIIRTMYGSKIE